MSENVVTVEVGSLRQIFAEGYFGQDILQHSGLVQKAYSSDVSFFGAVTAVGYENSVQFVPYSFGRNFLYQGGVFLGARQSGGIYVKTRFRRLTA